VFGFWLHFILHAYTSNFTHFTDVLSSISTTLMCCHMISRLILSFHYDDCASFSLFCLQMHRRAILGVCMNFPSLYGALSSVYRALSSLHRALSSVYWDLLSENTT